MPHFEIKNRWTGTIIYQAEAESLKALMEAAVKARISLNGASLNRASLNDAILNDAILNDASLNRASLNDASLNDASLNGAKGLRGYFCIGPIGSRMAYTWARWEDKAYMVHCGCKTLSLADFSKAVKEKHGETIHGKEYGAAIELMRVRMDATKEG